MGDNLEDFYIPKISENINFWMIRSKAGLFYNDFITNGYVAVGWNYIDSKINLDDALLKDRLVDEQKFVSKKSATRAINKCKMFMYEIKKCDIVLIPNKGMTEITIALLGEYYENNVHTIEEENKFMYDAQHRFLSTKTPECPYIKRRNIQILRSISSELVNYHLYSTLRNYNGIDDINEYAETILGMIYSLFLYRNRILISLEVNQEKDIDLLNMSGLLYGTSKYFEPYQANITTKVNVCSKGGIEVLLQNGLELLNAFGPYIFKSFMLIFTGKTILPQIPEIAKSMVTVSFEKSKQENEVEKQKLENESIKLENESKEIENEIAKENLKQLKIENNRIVSMVKEASEKMDVSTDKIIDSRKQLLKFIEE